MAVLVFSQPAHADEGMWLFNSPPRELLKQRYGFDITDAWLENLQLSAVRFSTGGSGSFVSANGLVMTNHHVGADSIQELSSEGKDYIRDGFHARTQAEELKCHNLELNVLVSTEDVTAKINGAVPSGASPAAAEAARRGVMSTLEQESTKATGLRSDVVTLFQGGRYHLYRYKKYTDVRLVFAPEKDIAFFGGDPDNFEYPRYDLDVSFFRVYEEGQPAKLKHYLKWAKAGVKEGDLTFVAGNPGKTNRLNTVAHLEFMRDRQNPRSLNTLRRREVLLASFSARSLENARRAQDELFSIQNSRKARLGLLAGLQDPSIMNRKRADEAALREAVAKNSKLQHVSSAWNDVATAVKAWDELHLEHYLLETGNAFNSTLFTMARTLVRMADESAKPNAERLREFRESNRASLEQGLFSTAEIYADLETIKLADSLSMFMEIAGANDPLLQKVLAGKSPGDRAARLTSETKLFEVSQRKKLAMGGKQAITDSTDPMIQLALQVDSPARKLRKTYEEKVEEPLRQAYARLADARFAIHGTATYPDATFTLRLAYGPVKGYQENGESLPAYTTLGGAYKHAYAHGNIDPFKLPERWMKRKDRLNLDTPFNFVSTADIIGGNSGSPVVNRAGELVGIIFDGNIYSLVLDFIFTEERARAVSVHSDAIIEALRRVYDANELADELTAAK